MSNMKWFPIQNGEPIPWPLMVACERQAVQNHGQTNEQLTLRGGLCSSEAVAVLKGRRWIKMDPYAADAELREIVMHANAKAIFELDQCRKALGRGWLTGGVSLAEGLRRKCAALERLSDVEKA